MIKLLNGARNRGLCFKQTNKVTLDWDLVFVTRPTCGKANLTGGTHG